MSLLIIRDKVRLALIDGNFGLISQLLDLPPHLCKEACDARREIFSQLLKLKPFRSDNYDKYEEQIVRSLMNHAQEHDFAEKLKLAPLRKG